MLNLPEDLKELFKADSVPKNLRLHFTDKETEDITNEQVEQESMTFTESISSTENIDFGTSERSKFEVTIHDRPNLKGKKFYASIEVPYDYTGSDDIKTPLEQLKESIDVTPSPITTHVKLSIPIHLFDRTDGKTRVKGYGNLELVVTAVSNDGMSFASIMDVSRADDGFSLTDHVANHGGILNMISSKTEYRNGDCPTDIIGNVFANGKTVKIYNPDRNTGLLKNYTEAELWSCLILYEFEFDLPMGWSIVVSCYRVVNMPDNVQYQSTYTQNIITQDGLDEPDIQDYNTATKKNYGKPYSPMLMSHVVSRKALGGNFVHINKGSKNTAQYARVEWSSKTTKARPYDSGHRIKVGNYDDFHLGNYYPKHYITPQPASASDTNLEISIETYTAPIIYPIWWDDYKNSAAQIHKDLSGNYAASYGKNTTMLGWPGLYNDYDISRMIDNSLIINCYKGNANLTLDTPMQELDPDIIYGKRVNEFNNFNEFDGSCRVNLSFISGNAMELGTVSSSGFPYVDYSEHDRQIILKRYDNVIRIYDENNKQRLSISTYDMLYKNGLVNFDTTDGQWVKIWNNIDDKCYVVTKVSCLNDYSGVDYFGNIFSPLPRYYYGNAIDEETPIGNIRVYGTKIYQVLISMILPSHWFFSIRQAAPWDSYDTFDNPEIMRSSYYQTNGWAINSTWTDKNGDAHFGSSANGKTSSVSTSNGDLTIKNFTGYKFDTGYSRIPTINTMQAENAELIYVIPNFRTLNDTTLDLSIVPSVEYKYSSDESAGRYVHGILGFRELNCYTGSAIISSEPEMSYYPYEWIGKTNLSAVFNTPKGWYGIPLGYFQVATCDKQADMKTRKLVAYSPDTIVESIENDYVSTFIKTKLMLHFASSFTMYISTEYLLHASDPIYWNQFQLQRVMRSYELLQPEQLPTINADFGSRTAPNGFITAYKFGFAEHFNVGQTVASAQYISNDESSNSTTAIVGVAKRSMTNTPAEVYAAWTYFRLYMPTYNMSDFTNVVYVNYLKSNDNDMENVENLISIITEIITSNVKQYVKDIDYIIPTNRTGYINASGYGPYVSPSEYIELYEQSVRSYLEEQLLSDINVYPYLLFNDLGETRYEIKYTQYLHFDADSEKLYLHQYIILPWSTIDINTICAHFSSCSVFESNAYKLAVYGASGTNYTVDNFYTNSNEIINPDELISVYNVNTANKRKKLTNFIVDDDETTIVDYSIPVDPVNVSNGNYYFGTSEITNNIFAYISATAQMNAQFIRVNRYGEYETYSIEKLIGLYPNDTLYPSPDLYPFGTDIIIPSSLYESAWFDDEPISKKYSKVKWNNVEVILNEDDDLEAYDISNNVLLSNKTLDETEKKIVEQLVNNIAAHLLLLAYMPASIELKGLPYLEAGDQIEIITNLDSIDTIIMKRTLKGIQTLKDTYESS